MSNFATIDRDPDPELLEIYLSSLNSKKAIEIMEDRIRSLTFETFSLRWYQVKKMDLLFNEISDLRSKIRELSGESIVRISAYLIKYIKNNPGTPLPDLPSIKI